MKKILISAFVLILFSCHLHCEDFSDVQIVSINVNTVSAKFLDGKIYRVINTNDPISVVLRKEISGKWKRKTIQGGQAIGVLIDRGYFIEVKDGGVSYWAATKSYRVLADPPHKYTRDAKLQPTFQYYYPVAVTSRDSLPGNDIRHYNFYSPASDRWHSVPYYNSSYPWYRDSIFTDPNYYRGAENRYYPPGYYGHPYTNW